MRAPKKPATRRTEARWSESDPQWCKRILKELDRMMAESGFTTRAAALRVLVRRAIYNAELAREAGPAAQLPLPIRDPAA